MYNATTFLTIIIPVYNGSNFIHETIQSVLQQPCQDYELILLDDGSKDNSLAICKEYESERVIVEHHENIGVSRTRNIGISMARGEVIIFIDQDDAMRSNFYTAETKSQLQTLLQQGVELFLNGTWYGDSRLKRGHFRSIEKLKKGIYDGHCDDLAWGNTYCFNANIFARSLFFDKKGKPTSVRFFDLPLDVETIFRHLTQYSAQKLLFSDKLSFCIRRVNEESVSSTWDWVKVYKVKTYAYFNVITWHQNNFPNDKDAIEGAKKAFLKVVNEMVQVNYQAGTNLQQLIEHIKNEPYYEKLTIFAKYYPRESRLFSLLTKNPMLIKKELHVSWLRKIIQLRWKFYNVFRRVNDIDLRKDLLTLS